MNTYAIKNIFISYFNFHLEEDLLETERGEGGFGSSDLKEMNAEEKTTGDKK